MDIKELLNKRYGDRGGWDGLFRIFSAELPYELKMENAKAQYRVSTSTVVDWYSKYRAYMGYK